MALTYRECYCFKDFLVGITPEDKYGVFNSELKIVVPFEYDYINDGFNDGSKDYFYAEKGGRKIFLPLDNITSPIDLGEVNLSKRIDSANLREVETSEPPRYSLIREKDGKFGIADIEGNFRIPPVYDDIIPFECDYPFLPKDDSGCLSPIEDRYVLLKDGKAGMASSMGVLTDAVYDGIHEDEGFLYTNGVYRAFMAVKDDKVGYIDEDGRALSEFKYEELAYPLYDHIGVGTDENGVQDFINLKTGKTIYTSQESEADCVGFKYQHLTLFNKADNKYYVINEDGEVIHTLEGRGEIEGCYLVYLNEKIMGYEKPEGELTITQVPDEDGNMTEETVDMRKRTCGIVDYNGKMTPTPGFLEFRPILGTTNFVAMHEKKVGDLNFVEAILDETGKVLRDDMHMITGEEGYSCYDKPLVPPLVFHDAETALNIFNIDVNGNILTDSEEIQIEDEISESNLLFDNPDAYSKEFVDVVNQEDCTSFFEFEKDGKYFAFSTWANDDIKVLDSNGKVLASINFKLKETIEEDYIEDGCSCGCGCGGDCSCDSEHDCGCGECH